ncbi:hypothetical protein SAMN02927900_03449 [Rhizobium mongolense subsp. loessense]|uniref:DUF1109 domain-containing protein n=1 Tax=Rhizobium mongolense subsp. loessense TaxID=158890 RepID=A0A1G4S8X5_9HYPH|nr:DUF1109 domain-containing protein [Rhizobium mongolense]SCW65461.1 hypothetical protein SAMN02927900_03449 [Rhizobium mongolense subsp. loessense]
MNDHRRPVGRTTDDLIKGLAMQAGKGSSGTPSLSIVLPATVIFSILAAISVVLLIGGARSDLIQIMPTWTFLFKFIGMILVAAGALQLTRTVVRPGRAVSAMLCLAPGLVFLLSGAVLDRSGFPFLGVRTYSAPNCIGMIVMASIPALAAVLAAMRAGTPTRLRRAGAVAGLLAGSVGGLAYTIACLNDGAAFVALWYSIAIAFVTAIGASVGPRILRW